MFNGVNHIVNILIVEGLRHMNMMTTLDRDFEEEGRVHSMNT
jgi:hypothetical protein